MASKTPRVAVTCALLTLFILPTAARAEAQVPSLIYQSWSKNQVGDYVVVEKVEENAEAVVYQRTRMELLSLAPSAAKIRLTVTRNTGSGWELLKTWEATLDEKVPADVGARQRRMEGAQKEGDEIVDVLGRRVPAHWFELTNHQKSGDTDVRVVTRSSFSNEVPGRVVGIDQDVYLPGTDTLVYQATTRVVDWSAASYPAKPN
ncbi:MAG: hypothetical protein QNK03_08345 [Myxococcota bacterium]|nr:hypothetical protein [Myxococcota bacterium]